MAPDTPEARQQAAEQCLTEALLKVMVLEAVSAAWVHLPQRYSLLKRLEGEIRWDRLRAPWCESMARHMTVAEIEAWARFVATPEGQSSIAKMATVNVETDRVTRPELQRALRAIGLT